MPKGPPPQRRQVYHEVGGKCDEHLKAAQTHAAPIDTDQRSLAVVGEQEHDDREEEPVRPREEESGEQEAPDEGRARVSAIRARCFIPEVPVARAPMFVKQRTERNEQRRHNGFEPIDRQGGARRPSADEPSGERNDIHHHHRGQVHDAMGGPGGV
ncbi:Uncharacterised protein [Mycobacteroides abscessus subsp. abscessus]|nr:Uncharacterised protein [Mycobacteroides abscessus subsp. abscessus]